ncbi:alpha-N-acetylgalactosaminide alpha-2,6-sialyltransferase 1-like [Xenopus laevis]|uniref:alpha-N-acetylgalactosaminide alpha-2,6-sialyltransferase n=1 Tax=Xenopus laevis TaxID=8355 RepID=A0A8J0U128_XENLA|nr:alpha-N-acetylgalactosaminide alpha-2,6-sialyltransferase 1-like [Xenopus laevis]
MRIFRRTICICLSFQVILLPLVLFLSPKLIPLFYQSQERYRRVETKTDQRNITVSFTTKHDGVSEKGATISLYPKSTKAPSSPLSSTIRRPLKAQDFAAEPKWSFGDEYTIDTLSTNTSCPTSVKSKALNAPWLSLIFLPKIILFMDNRHFSKQIWDRLQYFTPPYGWMALDYTVVKEVVSSLPTLLDQQILYTAMRPGGHQCISCAVVGNGGILNGSGVGQEIDSHDYVFRVNGAIIKGFENDVGTRTSFYGFSAFTMLSSLTNLNKRGFSKLPQHNETRYILFAEARRDYAWLDALQKNKTINDGILESYRQYPRSDFGDSFDPKKLLVAHPDFMRYLKNRFARGNTLKTKYWMIYRPSTGALLLLTALHLCDTVSAYGFMTEDYLDYSDHYYDLKKTPIKFYANHDFRLEKDLWNRLHKLNIIKLYQRT